MENKFSNIGAYISLDNIFKYYPEKHRFGLILLFVFLKIMAHVIGYTQLHVLFVIESKVGLGVHNSLHQNQNSMMVFLKKKKNTSGRHCSLLIQALWPCA